ncbi:MAG TPA: D-Ala-D-Ala carboxypeptidase family metallohydrolase [Sphingomicrobium sp.]
MSGVLTPLMLVAAQAAAPPPQVAPAPTPAVWNPAADYISAGQDEPGYRSWYLAAPWRAGQIKAFNDYLATWQVAGILPTWQLLRTATSWQKCGGQPFEVPPTSEWPHIVQTLRYVHDYVIPAVGPVEPVSGYRNPVLNQCAGGAPESAHKHYSAIDLVPLHATTREALMKTLCAVHARRGPDYGVGLGFYAFLRFHVDTTKFRRWNMDPAVASQCPPIVRPVDIATVGQPVPDQTGTTPASGQQPVPTDPAATPAVASAPATAPPPSPERGHPQH